MTDVGRKESTIVDWSTQKVFIKEETLVELKKNRVPVFLGTYCGEKVYAAIFTEDELKYILPRDDGS